MNSENFDDVKNQSFYQRQKTSIIILSVTSVSAIVLIGILVIAMRNFFVNIEKQKYDRFYSALESVEVRDDPYFSTLSDVFGYLENMDFDSYTYENISCSVILGGGDLSKREIQNLIPDFSYNSSKEYRMLIISYCIYDEHGYSGDKIRTYLFSLDKEENIQAEASSRVRNHMSEDQDFQISGHQVIINEIASIPLAMMVDYEMAKQTNID